MAVERLECPFCGGEVRELALERFLEEKASCPRCGAEYWLEAVDDLPDADLDLERQEWRVVRGYDFLVDFPQQPPEEGVELCVLFVRPRRQV